MSSEAAGFFLTDFCADGCQNRRKLDGDLEKKLKNTYKSVAEDCVFGSAAGHVVGCWSPVD